MGYMCAGTVVHRFGKVMHHSSNRWWSEVIRWTAGRRTRRRVLRSPSAATGHLLFYGSS